MEKLDVCVIFGGASSEHDISCVSVTTVLNNIDKEKYNVHTIGISKCGKWFYYEGTADELTPKNWKQYTKYRAVLSPDRGEKSIIKFTDSGYEKIHIDVVYPVLHGKNGEDGTIQGLFELAGIPYVGAGVIGSGVCMDKCIAKILFEKAGIPQADWTQHKLGDELNIELIEKRLGYPCFIKPSSAGSSYGVSKAKNKDELISGVKLALKHDYKVLIEKAINAREVECSVMGNFEPKTSNVLGEIKPAKEFYDFEAKYEDASSELLIPSELPSATADKVKEYAKTAYRMCECRGFARVDFFVDKDNGDVYLNEINTLPGFTPISMYPKLWENSGVDVKSLIDEHITFALERGDYSF